MVSEPGHTSSAGSASSLSRTGTNKAPDYRVILTVHYSPWSPYSGGGQRSVHNLATELGRRMKDVHVIYSKSPFESIPLPDSLPYTVHWASLPAFRSRRALFLRPLAAWSVQRVVRGLASSTGKPVIVHANGEEAARLGRLKKMIPFALIATPRYSFYPETLISGRKLTLPERIKLTLREGKYLAQAAVLRSADRICPPSNWAAGRIRKIQGVREEKIRVIPNGVPSEFLRFQWSPAGKGTPLLFFGRLSHDKGVDTLLHAYQLLPPERPPLIIAGTGPERKHLVSLSQKLEIEQDVEFKGWLTHEQLGCELSRCSICLLPSRVENYSLAILSAMAVGTPLITTRTGGTPELIRDGENGLLTEPGNPKLLSRAISALLSDPEKARKMGNRARKDVNSGKTWSDTCDQFEEVYEESCRFL
ncbi:MAG: glycosyltransferase family 4 protein [Balneolaceae bacterium]